MDKGLVFDMGRNINYCDRQMIDGRSGKRRNMTSESGKLEKIENE